MAAPSTETIEKARLKAQQAKAALQALEARASSEVRKLETRRKVILGGLLLDAASKDERFGKVLTALMQRIERAQDKRAFEGWIAPVSPPPSGGLLQSILNGAPPSPPPSTRADG
jgi:hypothetical protein